MKTKKPDIFLGITMGMLVLAAVLCLVILFAQKAGNADTTKNTMDQSAASKPADASPSDENNVPADPSGSEAEPIDTSSSNPVTPSESTTPSGPAVTDPHEPPSSEPTEPNPPSQPIDKAGLQQALNEKLDKVVVEFQVTVIDPSDGTTVSSTSSKCKEDDWMLANNVQSVFVMGAAFQAVADGTLTEDQILADVKSAVCKADKDAANRLVELLGGGDAKAGRSKVKEFAKANGVELGFNPSNENSSNKSWMQARFAAGLLNKICRRELVSAAYSDKMLEILLDAHENNVIDYNLTDEGIRYGFVDGEKKDGEKNDRFLFSMGVVRLGNGKTFVIGVTCNNLNSIDSAKGVVLDVINIAKSYFAE